MPLMLSRIGKTFRFEAAHRLLNHDGKCRNPHGHSYVVQVEFVGPVQPDGPKSGMVIDFGDVGKVWKEKLEPFLDHRDLNESLKDAIIETTAENIAAWIYVAFDEAGMKPDRVRVYETASSFAEFPARYSE